MIHLQCQCGRTLQAPEKALGRIGRCPGCGRELQLQIPAQSRIRLECFCGRMLSFPLSALGQTRHCPACGITLLVRSPQLVKTSCPCGKHLVSPRTMLGKTGHCPACGRILAIGASALLVTRCLCGRSYVCAPDLRGKPLRCQQCGLRLRVGDPPPLVTICPCGHHLITPRQQRGQVRTCPQCQRSLRLGATQPERIVRQAPRTPGRSAQPGSVPTKVELTASPTNAAELAQEATAELTPQQEQATALEQRAASATELAAMQEQVLDLPSASTAVIHFKCDCGQVHLVAGSQAGKDFTCFRCGAHLLVPAQKPVTGTLQEPATGTLQDKMLSPATEETSSAAVIHFKCQCGQYHTLEAHWAGQTYTCFRCGQQSVITLASSTACQAQEAFHDPYDIPDPYTLLELSPPVSLKAIKAAARQRQAGLDRAGERFQALQQAKDRLVKARPHLWYTLLHPQPAALQPHLPARLLKLHQRTVQLHRQAQQLEQQRLYHKASAAWRKAIAGWLELEKSAPFWQGLEKYAQQLFPRFKSQILAELQQDLLTELLLQLHTQWRDRYYAENNLLRARTHVLMMEPALRRLVARDPANVQQLQLLAECLMAQVEEHLEQGKYKKTLPLLRELLELMPNALEVRRFAADIYQAAAEQAFKRGKKREGQAYLQKAQEVDPQLRSAAVEETAVRDQPQ